MQILYSFQVTIDSAAYTKKWILVEFHPIEPHPPSPSPNSPQCDLLYVFVRTYFLLLRHLAFDFAFLFSSSGDDSDICIKSKHFPAWKALLFGINLWESTSGAGADFFCWTASTLALPNRITPGAAARISAQSAMHLTRGAVWRATKPRGSSTQMWEMSA